MGWALRAAELVRCIVALAVFPIGVLLVSRERLERFIASPRASV